MGHYEEGNKVTGYKTAEYGKLYTGNIAEWAHPKGDNLVTERSKGNDHRASGIEVSQETLELSKIIAGPMQSSRGIREVGNNLPEILYDNGKMKLSSDSGKHGEEV